MVTVSGVSLTLVDAFASRPFEGNPAAVCILDGPRDDEWMRLVACETNMPATAFLHPDGDGYALRWFKSAVELELCGHGTLSSAHVLWETGRLYADQPARFHTRAGPLSATLDDGWIELDFPATPPKPAPAPAGLVEALDVTPISIGRSRLDYIVEVAADTTVCGLRPDFERLRTINTRGVIVTSRCTSGDFDFVSRFFAPSTGLNEDSVTGSAHCCLGPYWGQRLGKSSLVGRQVSARGGTVKVRLNGDRVRLSGQALTVFRGELALRD